MEATYNSSADRDFVLALKVGVGFVSALSVIGGFLIVLTFCIRFCHSSDESRYMLSAGRLILVNLSIADIVVAASHLWGLALGYDMLRRDDVSANSTATDTLCSVQGAFAVYSTIASFLWTIILSFFVFATLVLPKKQLYGNGYAFLTYFLIGWALPLSVLVVLAVNNEFGFQHGNGLVWCYTLARDKERSVFVNLYGYDLWACFTLILLMGLFFSVVCYTCKQPRPKKKGSSETAPLLQSSAQPQPEPLSSREHTSDVTAALENFLQAVQPQSEPTSIQGASSEKEMNSAQTEQSQPMERRDFVKLIIAALILVILRIWETIYSILCNIPSYQDHIHDSKWILALIYLAGVGDSAQGFANAVLFLLFTKTYRNWMIQTLTGCCKHRNDS